MVNVKEDALVALGIVSDVSYAWRLVSRCRTLARFVLNEFESQVLEFVPLMQQVHVT